MYIIHIWQVIGLGWSGYWAKSWLTWNRFDFFLLGLTYIDLILDFLTQYDGISGNLNGIASTSVMRIFRFFKLIRFGRALRLFKVCEQRIRLGSEQ